MSIVKRYITLCEKDIKYSIIGLIFGCTGSYYGVYASEHTSRIMQGDFSKDRLVMLLYTNIIAIIFASVRGTLFAYSQRCMNLRMRKIVFDKIINQETTFYEKVPVNTLLEYINNDVRIVSDIISLNINVISRSSIHVIATLWLLSKISWKLTILACILLPINIKISDLYDKYHTFFMNGFEDLNKKINTYVHESISHISIIKTYATETKSNKLYCDFCDKLNIFNYKESLLYGSNLLVVSNIPTITTIAIIIAAQYFNTIDGLVTFILHNQSLYEHIKAIIHFKNEFVKCKGPYKRITELLDSQNIKEGYYIPDKDIRGDIEFKNISFKYHKAETDLIINFNFKINHGEKIAIIGASGSGKSTLVKLLIGILSKNSGNIYIDDVDVSDYDNRWLKKRIGYVAQDSILFSDTIANNIAYGMDNISEEDIIEAAIKANAHEFISKLPDKYQTKLEGTELSSLSGGQKQRISIARALIRKPQILIFDEATSALDPYCEELVQNTIKECFANQNSTMIIIAHRKSALDIADKIYKFEGSALTIVSPVTTA
jgi:ABC-type multidrug transport system fused ATPase/permease subunit